jgi:iron complex outermembrane receptor protein
MVTMSQNYSLTQSPQSVPLVLTGDTLFFHKDLSPRMGDFHRLGIRAGLQNELWQLALSVTNVFNTRGNTFAFGNSFSLNATSQYNPLRPRTMSLNYVRSF